MSLMEIIDENAITTEMQALEKQEAIEELLDLLVKTGKVKDREKALTALLEREKKGSTGLEKGVAVPHAKTDAVDELCMAIGISKEGVDFDALDGEYSYIFFLMLAPPGITGPHVEALAEIARLVEPPVIREKLVNAKSPQEIIEIIKEFEEGT